MLIPNSKSRCDDLANDLENIRGDLRVPALAAAAFIKGELCDIAAVGRTPDRRQGTCDAQ